MAATAEVEQLVVGVVGLMPVQRSFEAGEAAGKPVEGIDVGELVAVEAAVVAEMVEKVEESWLE